MEYREKCDSRPMIYKTYLEQKISYFKQHQTFILGDYNTTLLINQQLSIHDVTIAGFVNFFQLKTNESLKEYNVKDFLEHLNSNATTEYAIILAFCPTFENYEDRLQQAKDLLKDFPTVKCYDTSELLGEFSFHQSMMTLDISEKDGENLLNDFFLDLTDDISKNILKSRISYEFSPHYNAFKLLYTQNASSLLQQHKATLLQQNFKLQKNKPVIFYGIGIYTNSSITEHHLKLVCPEILDIPRIYCDRRTAQFDGQYGGFPLITPTELVEKYSDSSVVIATYNFEQEVRSFLLQNGFNETQLFSTLRNDDKNQYFEENLISFNDHEIFVDVGVFDGQTSILFSQKCNYDKIFLFEPNKKYIDISKANLEKNNVRDYEIIPYGLWDEETTLEFSGSGVAFKVSNNSNNSTTLPVTTLDACLKDIPVTFIKMDIEGSEYKALRGAKEIISKHKPKLAISIYHKKEDLLQIQQYIKSLVPEYRYFLRHYQTDFSETILYALL